MLKALVKGRARQRRVVVAEIFDLVEKVVARPREKIFREPGKRKVAAPEQVVINILASAVAEAKVRRQAVLVPQARVAGSISIPEKIEVGVKAAREQPVQRMQPGLPEPVQLRNRRAGAVRDIRVSHLRNAAVRELKQPAQVRLRKTAVPINIPAVAVEKVAAQSRAQRTKESAEHKPTQV